MYANGDIYQGNWKNNMMDGKGIFSSINGDSYEGNFKNN
jgi:hypothetical protein